MSKRFVLVILCALAPLTASCTRPAAKPRESAPDITPAPEPQPAQETGPFLKIQSRQELSFGAGAKAMFWNLQGEKVKELTVRLVVCNDGKADRENEIVGQWQEPSKPFQGQLALLVQDGQPFGAKGKRLPSISLHFQSGGPGSSVRKSHSALIPAELGSKMSMMSNPGEISRKDVIYREVSAPVKEGARSLNLGSEESLLEASKDGGVALGVVVEWK